MKRKLWSLRTCVIVGVTLYFVALILFKAWLNTQGLSNGPE